MRRWTIVVGLHRSGTSAVAGVLHHLGINMGLELMPANDSNLRGFYEDMVAYRLHQQMIGPWERPLVRVTPELREQYHAYFRERESYYDHNGLKDPRLCYLLPETLQRVSPQNTKIITTYRSLRASAKSIAERQALSIEDALRVAGEYDLERARSLHEAEELGIPILDVLYNQLVSDPARVVGVIAGFVGMDVTEEAVEFIEPGLRHYR